jgi:poly(U)-specific endoribonuclease
MVAGLPRHGAYAPPRRCRDGRVSGALPDRRRFLLGLGASAALLPLAAGRARRALATADGVYQRIWDADQAGRGIPALAAGSVGDARRGYVKVDLPAGRDPEHRLFAEVHIPDHKRLSYDLCRALFDNFRLDQTKVEDTTPAEARETLALLDAIARSAPMRVARDHLEREHGLRYADAAWQELIFDVWFRPFDDGRNRDLSGFEHVVVGEQKAGRVNGYHFWYKYYLDDGPVFLGTDDIDFDGMRYDRPSGGVSAEPQVPEIVTLAYRWQARDFDTGAKRSLYKPIGGFFVGCSVEGLLALGLVRFFERGEVETVINRARLRIDLHRSPDGRSLRSYFPRFLGLA